MDPQTELSAILERAASAVRQEGALLRAEFHNGRRGSGNKAKIDEEIEARLRRRLLELVQCNWVAEEDGSISADSPYCWIVDPHDGTRAFLEGLRGSAISVALVEGDVPLLGIVYAPLAPDDDGDFFCWAKGGPVFRNGVALPPLTGPLPDKIVIALNDKAGDYALANHHCYYPARILALPSIAYRLALAAAGEVHVGLSLTWGIEDYDVAGGHALVHGARGHVLQTDGKEITYRGGCSYRGSAGGHPAAVKWMLGRNPVSGGRVARRPARPPSRIADAAVLRRVQGTLLGQLAGDALGSLVEFQTPEQIRSQYPRGVIRMEDGGTWGTIAGQPTDDGEMALALARSLLAEGGFNAAAVGDAYVRWSASGPFDIGGTTQRGIRAIRGKGTPDTESEANGGLMRVSPVGIFAAHDPSEAARLARQDCALTHPNPVCLAASAAFAAAIAEGIAGGNRERMWKAACEHACGEARTIRDILELASHEPPRNFIKNQGHVLIALQNAFYHLCAGTGFEEALVETVSQGGDSDTNGAVCGALLGAAEGRDAIPLAWRQAVLSCRAVEDPTVRHPRPAEYWPDDALDVAEALYVLGSGKP